MKKLLSFLLVFLLVTAPALADVAFDSTFEKGQASPVTSPFSFVSNTGSPSGTVGVNTNRGLFACAMLGARSASTGAVSMTWNGVSMTQIAGLDFPGGGTGSLYLFELHADANIATGNQSLAVSWATTAFTSMTVYLGAASFYNVDQATGVQNSGSDSATSTAASSTVTSASGNMAVACNANRNASSTTLDAGPTQAWLDGAHDNNSGQAYNLSSSGSTVISWTLGSSVAWVNVKTDVIKASAAASRRAFTPFVFQ